MSMAHVLSTLMVTRAARRPHLASPNPAPQRARATACQTTSHHVRSMPTVAADFAASTNLRIVTPYAVAAETRASYAPRARSAQNPRNPSEAAPRCVTHPLARNTANSNRSSAPVTPTALATSSVRRSKSTRQPPLLPVRVAASTRAGRSESTGDHVCCFWIRQFMEDNK